MNSNTKKPEIMVLIIKDSNGKSYQPGVSHVLHDVIERPIVAHGK